jgi:hypothetical protein
MTAAGAKKSPAAICDAGRNPSTDWPRLDGNTVAELMLEIQALREELEGLGL